MKIFFSIFLIVFIFSGCTPMKIDKRQTEKSVETLIQNKEKGHIGEGKKCVEDESMSDQERIKQFLEKYSGVWIVEKFIAPVRVGIVNYSHALQNTTHIGKMVIIEENGVVFQEERYTPIMIGFREKEQLLGSYLYNDIFEICGEKAEFKNEPWENLNSITKIYFEDTENEECSFCLCVRNDGNILIELGERYEYMGYYTLALK